MSQMLPEEKETIINFDETGEPAVIYTASEKTKNRLIKAGLEPVETLNSGAVFQISKKNVRVKIGRYSCYLCGR